MFLERISIRWQLRRVCCFKKTFTKNNLIPSKIQLFFPWDSWWVMVKLQLFLARLNCHASVICCFPSSLRWFNLKLVGFFSMDPTGNTAELSSSWFEEQFFHVVELCKRAFASSESCKSTGKLLAACVARVIAALLLGPKTVFIPFRNSLY